MGVADYPKLHALLGAGAFRALVVPSLRAFPTRHPSLREAGAHLAAFLDNPLLADLVRLERARTLDADEVLAPTFADVCERAGDVQRALALLVRWLEARCMRMNIVGSTAIGVVQCALARWLEARCVRMNIVGST